MADRMADKLLDWVAVGPTEFNSGRDGHHLGKILRDFDGSSSRILFAIDPRDLPLEQQRRSRLPILAAFKVFHVEQRVEIPRRLNGLRPIDRRYCCPLL